MMQSNKTTAREVTSQNGSGADSDAGAVTPRIVLGGDSPPSVFLLLTRLSQEPRGIERVALKALIDEGRRFAETEEGRQAAGKLGQSLLYKNGKILWTIAGIDEMLAQEGPHDAGIEQALHEVLFALQIPAIEEIVMRFLEEYAKSAEL